MTIINDPRPNFANAEAREFLQAHFGIEGELTILPSERDQNFLVETAEGRRLTFKIMNAAEPLSAIEFQTSLLRHLESCEPGLAVPRILPTSDRTGFALINSGSGQHALRLVSYLPGSPTSRRGEDTGNIAPTSGGSSDSSIERLPVLAIQERTVPSIGRFDTPCP